MLQTLDSDLSKITDLLQRMRDLSVRGLNGVYSDSEKAMIMNETNQLGYEIKRIAQSSTFADKKLLDPASSDSQKIFIDDKGINNYLDLSNISKNMLFADVLAKDKNVYMMGMTPGQTSNVEFNGKLYQINNTSADPKTLVYGYEEDLANQNNSITLIQDSTGVTKSFTAAYQNDQVQMGNGEMYLNLAGGVTAKFTVGGDVFSLTNSDASQQTAVFKTSGTTLNMVSGQNVSGSYVSALSGYNTATGAETGASLNGSQQKYVNFAGQLYSLQNNSATEETLVFKNNAGNLQALSGNVTPTSLGSISATTNLNGDKYKILAASQELFYNNGGTVYSLKNNTAQAQTAELTAANVLVNPNTSVSNTAQSTVTGATGMTNPFSIDAVAGQNYYVRSNDNSTLHQLTASGTGKLLIDFDGTNINAIGGVGAVNSATTAPVFENVTPNGLNKFTINVSASQQEAVTIGSEIYKITNSGAITSTVTFTYNSLAKSIAVDNPSGNVTVNGYQGNLANKTALGANDYYVSNLAAGASAYMIRGTDIFKITNSTGGATDSIFNYNAGGHTLTSGTPGMNALLLSQPTFTGNVAGDKGLKFNAGQTQFVQFGNDNFEIKNNTANQQSISFSYNAGNLIVNDAGIAASLTITKHVCDPGQALAAGDVYATMAAGQSKYLSVANKYFQVNNTSGARTSVFKNVGNTLNQQIGTGVNNAYQGDESFETTSTASDYYIEMTAGKEQYIKVGSYAYKMDNISGTTKTDVFTQSGSNLISQNPNITELNMPIANQNNFSQLMPIIDWSMGLVNDKRSEVGSRLAELNQTVNRNLSKVLNLSSANSVIRDTDVSKESANFMRASILRNMGINMFQQVKSLNSELALKLLA